MSRELKINIIANKLYNIYYKGDKSHTYISMTEQQKRDEALINARDIFAAIDEEITEKIDMNRPNEDEYKRVIKEINDLMTVAHIHGFFETPNAEMLKVFKWLETQCIGKE